MVIELSPVGSWSPLFGKDCVKKVKNLISLQEVGMILIEILEHIVHFLSHIECHDLPRLSKLHWDICRLGMRLDESNWNLSGMLGN